MNGVDISLQTPKDNEKGQLNNKKGEEEKICS